MYMYSISEVAGEEIHVQESGNSWDADEMEVRGRGRARSRV